RKGVDRIGWSIRCAETGKIRVNICGRSCGREGWCLNDQHARQHDPWLLEPLGQEQPCRQRGRQCASWWTGDGEHELRALVQSRPRVVEGVDGRARLEVQVSTRIEAFQQVPKERRDIVDVERWVVLPGNNQQIFRQRELSLAEDRVRAGEQFLWLA